MEPRLTFEEIQNWIFSCDFDLCSYALTERGRFHLKKIHRIHNIVFNNEHVFARPIERLMYLAVLLTLGCDCTNDEIKIFRNEFECELSDYDLDQLLSEIPEIEARIFRSHLRSIDENFQIRDKNKSAV